MSRGSVTTGADCLQNSPPSRSSWRTARLVYNQADGVNVGTYVQPSQFTTLMEGQESPYEDPSIALVTTSCVASVRNLQAPAGEVNPEALDLGEDGEPMAPLATTALGGARSSTRGLASPQFRIIFTSGDNVRRVIFVDGQCTLALPAKTVSVAALTQPLLVPATDGRHGAASLIGALVTEAQISAEVAWSKGGSGSAPQGMATFTQNLYTNVVAPMFFERPPFARRVQPIPPVTKPGAWEFVSDSAGQTLVIPPPASNVQQRNWDVPHAAQHIVYRLTPPTDLVERLAVVVWEIGVR